MAASLLHQAEVCHYKAGVSQLRRDIHWLQLDTASGLCHCRAWAPSAFYCEGEEGESQRMFHLCCYYLHMYKPTRKVTALLAWQPCTVDKGCDARPSRIAADKPESASTAIGVEFFSLHGADSGRSCSCHQKCVQRRDPRGLAVRLCAMSFDAKCPEGSCSVWPATRVRASQCHACGSSLGRGSIQWLQEMASKRASLSAQHFS